MQPSDYPSLDNTILAFPYQLGSFALALLLVFKTNASYARWAEARLAWEKVYSSIRNMSAKTQAFAPATMTEKQRKMFVRWIITLPYVMRSHLLSYVPGTLVLEPLLSESECVWLEKQPHMPIAAAQVCISICSDHAGLRIQAMTENERSQPLARKRGWVRSES